MIIDGYATEISPERRLELSRSILDEVTASEAVIGTFPGTREVPMLDSWNLSNPEEIHLALGFRRAREIIQAFSFGENRWQLFNGLAVELGERPPEEPAEVTANTERLLHLIILSRVPVQEMDEHWSMPSAEDIRASKQMLRQELFISSTPDIWDFSATTYDELVGAIAAGLISIGNPVLPDVPCWREPPAPERKSWLKRFGLVT